MKRKFQVQKRTNFLFVFLVLDLFALLTIFNPSNASYVSEALGTAEMEVALYAFSYNNLSEYDKDDNLVSDSVDINLGVIKPGDTKYYKFDVYNYLEDAVSGDIFSSETSISYALKIITTTNLPLTYKLYLNQTPFSSSSSDLIGGTDPSSNKELITDGFGTFYKVFPIDERCFKLDTEELKMDRYTLVVEFPEEYSEVVYQDLIESIKIQLESKQVLPGDSVLDEGICR